MACVCSLSGTHKVNIYECQIFRNLPFPGYVFLHLCFLPYETWPCDIVEDLGLHTYVKKQFPSQKSVGSCYYIRESQHWITGTSQREGYPKTLIRIKSGVFHVSASLIRHFWFFFWQSIHVFNNLQVLEWLFCCNSIIFPLNNNISPFSWCFTWSIGPT